MRAPPQRVLIHWIGEAARSATLAISASVLRHVPAEAVYVGIVAGAGGQRRRTRTACANCSMRARRRRRRTDWRCAPSCTSGTSQQQLARRLAEAPGQMLIVGVSGPRRTSPQRFRALLDGGRWPVLIVHRGASRELPPAEHPAGLRAHVRLHDRVPEHHRAAAAGGAGAGGRLDALERLRAHRLQPARAGLLPAVLRRLAAGGLHQPRVRLHHRLDAGALRVPGPQDHRRPDRHALRAAHRGLGHRPHHRVRAERLDRAATWSRSASRWPTPGSA